ncbi:hypothetical protein FB451DRAFT_1169887 [Mycena latifolia]|nr:hypothetical protein FB451DRAFT_1169887 [Mycena latifolia]
METIPPEIWTEVFAFACTDDGSTGRALGEVRLLKFLAALSDLAPGERKVKYLFIANLDELKNMESSGGGIEIRRQLHADSNRDLADQALCCVLHLVSSSLLALHIHRTTISRQSLFLEMDLPALTELTLHGPFNQRNRLISDLTHFHLYGESTSPTSLTDRPSFLSKSCMPPHGCSFTPYAVQVALGILKPIGAASEAVSLPSSLATLMIELNHTSSVESSASNTRAIQFLRKLQKIADGDSRVRLVDGRVDWMPVQQAKEEWLEEGRCPVEVGCGRT